MTQTAKAFSAEERRDYIGASEIAAILGLDQYKTPLDIYNLKLGRVPPFAGNAQTARGNRLEAIAAEQYTELTGLKLQRRNQAFVHPQYPFIVGHIDRVVVGERRIAEIKCPSIGTYRKYQRTGLPESMILQLQVYLGLTGYPTGSWIIFCADAWDLATFDIEFDQTIYDHAIDAAARFWNNHVLPKMPPQTVDADKPTIEFEKIGGDVVHREDEKFSEAAQMLCEAANIKADGETLFELAKAKVLEAIEEVPGRYEGAGLRLAYYEQAGRKTFDQKLLGAEHPEIDLSKYTKQGNPFKTFRPIFIQGDRS